MSKLQLMEMVQPRVRRLEECLMQLWRLVKTCAVGFTQEIYSEYIKSKRQRDYENRPEIRKKRNKRRQEAKRAKFP